MNNIFVAFIFGVDIFVSSNLVKTNYGSNESFGEVNITGA